MQLAKLDVLIGMFNDQDLGLTMPVDFRTQVQEKRMAIEKGSPRDLVMAVASAYPDVSSCRAPESAKEATP